MVYIACEPGEQQLCNGGVADQMFEYHGEVRMQRMAMLKDSLTSQL